MKTYVKTTMMLAATKRAAMMLLALMLTTTGAWAEALPEIVSVSYVKADGTTGNVDATVLTNGDSYLGSSGQTTWYVVNSDISHTGRITLEGDVNIILGDGKTMTVDASFILDVDGIEGNGSNGYKDLTIYGQTAQSGTLSITAAVTGIDCKNVTINGGTVNVTGNVNGISASNQIVINDGAVTATAKTGASIYGTSGISINGGQVTATGESGAIANTGVANITLGYKNATDFISFKSIDAGLSVRIASGKMMTDGTNTYSSSTSPVTLESLRDVTLRPVTETHTVTFDIADYDDDPASQIVAHNTKATDPAPTRKGYTLSSWKNGGVVYDFNAAVTSDLNLTAEWIANTYYVEFDSNGVPGDAMDNQEFTYDVSQNLTANTYTRKNYLFMGWNTADDGSGDDYENGKLVENLTSENGATVTLYAQWKKDIDKWCTAEVPNPIYRAYAYHGYFYDGTWNDNHGGIKVYDDETLLTYYHYDSEEGDFVGDYRFSMLESLDGGSCENLGEHCRVHLEGLGDYAGELTVDVVIVPATVDNKPWGSHTWNLDSDGKFTINGEGAMKAADTFRDYPWYNYCSYFTSITIGENITTVAAKAFGGDNNTNPYAGVTTLSLPSTLEEIGNNAFAYCTNLTFDANSLITNDVTIGETAFNQVGCIEGFLKDASNNSKMLGIMHDAKTANVKFEGRTIYKDGKWNTLCLPFDVVAGSGWLEDATAMRLNKYVSGFNASTGELTLYFYNVEDELDKTIHAGTPFIVKWAEADDISSPEFDGVAISKEAGNDTSNDGTLSFVGTFSPVELAAGDKSNLYLGGANKLYTPSAKRDIGSFRGYFHLNSPASIKRITLNFGDDETVTEIIDVRGQMEDVRSAKGWFTLQGVQLTAEPTVPGIYIKDGVKTAVK